MNAAALAWPVNIGMASRMSGVTPKMIRHYETLGLLPAVGRTDSGYRQYGEADVHTLRFIKRARELGFAMSDIGELVGLWRNRRRASSSVKRIAQKHTDELSQKIAAMQAMQRALDQLIYCCQGDERPDCPILDDLAGLHDDHP
ncbi:Cu(I)-responsive transcriptional regulator [Ramlibacter sp.]|uniref:Cu(I)-responsive transcriptional regulator n=1 Tax=Ramlibacter sp. TaxID=1917967 RepID=UPI002BD6F153|nr:Cu(I)-responsive transcriptional regulator [Ramlibacter sp.]HWI83522.1 Cu(I)-responsive transcriptional regulator [Ramlibacter sp.]